MWLAEPMQIPKINKYLRQHNLFRLKLKDLNVCDKFLVSHIEVYIENPFLVVIEGIFIYFG